MDLSQLLQEVNLDPATTLVMRHQPMHPDFRRIFPWLAAERPDLYNAYQQYQKPRVENQLLKATHIASFFGDQPGRALFVGLYENRGHHLTTRVERNQMSEFQELAQYGDEQVVEECLYFDLALTEHLSKWKGKLIVNWPPPDRSWSRWGNSPHPFEVKAILEDSALTPEMGDWRELVFSWYDLQVIPQKWQQQLHQWRGIYFILDESDGKGYVGSAYGKDNLLGRWQTYAKTGHGGNKKLLKRKPENLRFSILERVSPDTPADEVIQLEATWKNRLHTREQGMNEN